MKLQAALIAPSVISATSASSPNPAFIGGINASNSMRIDVHNTVKNVVHRDRTITPRTSFVRGESVLCFVSSSLGDYSDYGGDVHGHYDASGRGPCNHHHAGCQCGGCTRSIQTTTTTAAQAQKAQQSSLTCAKRCDCPNCRNTTENNMSSFLE